MDFTSFFQWFTISLLKVGWLELPVKSNYFYFLLAQIYDENSNLK